MIAIRQRVVTGDMWKGKLNKLKVLLFGDLLLSRTIAFNSYSKIILKITNKEREILMLIVILFWN